MPKKTLMSAVFMCRGSRFSAWALNHFLKTTVGDGFQQEKLLLGFGAGCTDHFWKVCLKRANFPSEIARKTIASHSKDSALEAKRHGLRKAAFAAG